MKRLQKYDRRDYLCFAEFPASTPLTELGSHLASQPGVRLRSATRWLLEFEYAGVGFEVTSDAWRHLLWETGDTAPAAVRDEAAAICNTVLATPRSAWYSPAWIALTTTSALAAALVGTAVAQRGGGIPFALLSAALSLGAVRLVGEWGVLRALRGRPRA